MWTLPSAPSEKYWDYKEIFQYISSSRLLCFWFNDLVFKRFACVKWSFEVYFWKKVAKKNVNKSRKIITQWAYTALRFLHKKWLWIKYQLHVALGGFFLLENCLISWHIWVILSNFLHGISFWMFLKYLLSFFVFVFCCYILVLSD